MVGSAVRIRPGSGPLGSGLGPQRGGFRSSRLKNVNTTFSLLVGNGRGFAQGILPLFVLSASSLFAPSSPALPAPESGSLA